MYFTKDIASIDKKDVDKIFDKIFGLDLGSKEVQEAVISVVEAIDRFGERINELSSKRVQLELKRCPICGCTAHIHKGDELDKYYVACGYCPIKTDAIFNDEEEAAEFWNDREQ